MYKKNDGEGEAPKSSLLPILAYCASSILMTLSNKFALSQYNFHLNFLLCAIQSIACVLLLEWFNSLGLVRHRPFNWEDSRRWFPVSVALVAMIYSGSKALQHMSIPFFTIFKNLTIIIVAYSEFAFINGPSVTAPILFSFLLMVLSSVIAAWPDIAGSTVAAAGESPPLLKYGWMFINCLCSAFYVVAMKFKQKKVKFKDFDTVFFNNLLSIPVLLVCSLLTEVDSFRLLLVEFGKAEPRLGEENLFATRPASDWAPMWFAVLLSSVFSFAISYCTSWCIRMTTSTTYSMVGALNKLPIAVFGMIVFKDKLNFFSVSGVFVAFSAGLLYSYAKSGGSSKLTGSYVKLASPEESVNTSLAASQNTGTSLFDPSSTAPQGFPIERRHKEELALPYHHGSSKV